MEFPDQCSVRRLHLRFVSGNADVKTLFNATHNEWVCYLVPEDPDEPGVYMCQNGAGQVCVEINVPYSTLIQGYENYLRQGFAPPISVNSGQTG